MIALSAEQVLKIARDYVSRPDSEDVLNFWIEELFEYFLNTGDMPYGTAKARTGDPSEWIGEQLQRMA